MENQPPEDTVQEFLIRIRGTVQGVGFRPFIARLAERHEIAGWVRNDENGVTIAARQTGSKMEDFIAAIRQQSPPAAQIDELTIGKTGTGSEEVAGFKILESPEMKGNPLVPVTPDLCICPDCREELLQPGNRRYQYPFINCTNCGPRYSIVETLPYDRERTTMSTFRMCPDCEVEYSDPKDRRYHAQPNACPECGPRLELISTDGTSLATGPDALTQACEALASQRIVAVKGLGGFHLYADATDHDSVQLLRSRKQRDQKPFAVMFPDIDSLREHAFVSAEEAALLQSAAAPIVLVKRLQQTALVEEIAPGNPFIGAILPYTPLHILLMKVVGKPLVATSANLSEEPLCYNNPEAIERLGGIADLVLLHDRPIARPIDDSVIRQSRNGPIVLRRARGYAPAPLRLPESMVFAKPLLSVGAHLKNTIAIGLLDQVIVSPHIGDLSNQKAVSAFRNTIDLLGRLYGGKSEKVACDLHPDYISTRFAESLGVPVVPVQHHLAHVMACLLEHGGGPDRVLGVVWDGTGYGEDGTIWGGEFILVDRVNRSARRVGHLKPFPLPGGEVAIRRTARSALGALYAGGLLEAPHCHDTLVKALKEEVSDMPILIEVLRKGINTPMTSSAGRLFDAAAALLSLASRNSFEGQAGMAMESAADQCNKPGELLPYSLNPSRQAQNSIEIDWAPMLECLCKEVLSGVDRSSLAMRFHQSLSSMILDLAREVGVEHVALTGGCFQNAILTDTTCDMLENAGFKALLHHKLSPNDNSISAGQAYASLLEITRVQT